MPTSAELAWAVDTSVAVAYLDAAHSAHQVSVEAMRGRSAALAGHAAFEAYAVLTRLPGRAQVDPAAAIEALCMAFPEPCWLSGRQQRALFDRLGTSGLSGGMVYDALVGEAARVNGRTLLTRDRRAIGTYEFLGVHHELITTA